MAHAFQVASLEVAGVGREDVAKVRSSQFELVFTEVSEAKLEANSGDAGRKSFGFEKGLDSLIEPAGPEIDDAQVGI